MRYHGGSLLIAMHIVNEIKKDNESIPFVCLAILTWAGVGGLTPYRVMIR